MTTSIDANQQVQAGYTDTLGRTRSTVAYEGIYGGTLTAIRRTTAQYNALGKPTAITVTDLAPQSGQSITEVTTTAQYDDLGRPIVLTDPDRGTHTLTSNANGQVVKDVAGSRTLGISYDLLGRAGCLQDVLPTPDPKGACTSGAKVLVQNTYDANPSGVTWTNVAVGRLTQTVATTTYPDGKQAVVTEQMQYDQRSRLLTSRMTITGTALSVANLSAAQVLGNQVSDPYSNQRYKQGNLGTEKGYTGQ